MEGPSTMIAFLGIELDTEARTVRLTEDKLRRLQREIRVWRGRKICTKRDLLLLIGQLQHVCCVVKPGRTFLWRMIDLSSVVKELHHRIRLNKGFRSDLQWWFYFLPRWNGHSMMSGVIRERWDITLTSDASGSWGCGAYTSTGEWLQLKWPQSWEGVHITVKELVPIVVGVARWGRQWEGRIVRCRRDNAATVAIVNSGKSKVERAMHLMRSLFFFWLAIMLLYLGSISQELRMRQQMRYLDITFTDSCAGAMGQTSTYHRADSNTGSLGGATARLDRSELDRIVSHYFIKGLADSTHKAYGSAQRRYLAFCRMDSEKPVPATESTLCRFVSYLATEKLKHRTIKSYLSGARYLHISEAENDPFTRPLHRLEYTLRGVKRCEAEAGVNKRVRLPISPEILRKMKTVWEVEVDNPDKAMLWAACCLGFFCFLRAGEMTVPNDHEFDPAVHLTKKDITVDNQTAPHTLQVRLKQSKTDPFRQGIYLFVGKTGSDLCPVSAVLAYLAVRGKNEGPLFTYQDGR